MGRDDVENKNAMLEKPSKEKENERKEWKLDQDK